MAIRITGSASGLDTNAMVQELVKAYDEKGKTYTKSRTKTEWKQEAWKTLNNKIKSFYTKYADTMRFSGVYNKKTTTVSNSSVASIVAADNAVKGTQTLQVKQLAKAGYLTGGKLADLSDGTKISSSTKLSDILQSTITDGTTISLNIGAKDNAEDVAANGTAKTITVNSDTTVGDFVKALNGVDGITASFDEGNGRFFISSKDSGVTNNFNFIGNSDAANAILSGLKLTGDEAVKIQGDNAQITLNKAEFESSSNTFAINGLTITAKAVTAENEVVSLVTDNDVDAIYDSVKNFIKEYNTLINELDTLYNAEAAKDYEPLTDEEKDAMSDDEIEKWEKKIKDSLLRRDSDIDTLASAMRNAMLSTFDITALDGSVKTYSLSNFGIETLSYFEAEANQRNAYHIAGNADDEATSAQDDKLRSMIATDPSAVSSFFTQLSTKLYDSMYKIQSESNNYTAYGSFYSDKKLKSEYDDQTKQITKWEDYVAKIEEKYYKQFTAMESALSEMQSQQSYISQLFA